MGILAVYSDPVTVASLKPWFEARCLQYQSVGLCRKSQSCFLFYLLCHLYSSLPFQLHGIQCFVGCCMNFWPCASTTFPNSFWLLEPLSYVMVTSAFVCLFWLCLSSFTSYLFEHFLFRVFSVFEFFFFLPTFNPNLMSFKVMHVLRLTTRMVSAW